MQSTIVKLSAALALLARAALWLSGLGLVLMTAFIAWQVFGRFVLNDTPTWTESGSTLLMGWFILLGAAVGIREGNHLSFDVLVHVLGPRARAVLGALSEIVVIGFGGGMIGYGIQLARTTWPTTIPNLGFSGGVAFLALICGGLLMIAFAGERILRRLAGLPVASFVESDADEG